MAVDFVGTVTHLLIVLFELTIDSTFLLPQYPRNIGTWQILPIFQPILCFHVPCCKIRISSQEWRVPVTRFAIVVALVVSA